MSSTDDSSVASVYVLTPLTRDAGKSRRVIVQGFDVPWRNVMITGCAFIIGLIPMGFMWMFVGQVAILVEPIVIGAAFYLIERRTRSGLRLRTYEAALDKRRAVVNLFLCCGVPVDPSQNAVRLLKSSSAPTVRIDDLDAIDIALTGGVLSTHSRGHEPEIAPPTRPIRRSHRSRNAEQDTSTELYAPSSHESFWSDRGAPEISDEPDTGLVFDGPADVPAPDHQDPVRDHADREGPGHEAPGGAAPAAAAAPAGAVWPPVDQYGIPLDLDAALAFPHLAEPKGLRGRLTGRGDRRQDQPTP